LPKLSTLPARKEWAFIAVNCAALPEPLLESELFGYERGAFKGCSKPERTFHSSHGGTLFLDEIGTCPSRPRPSSCGDSRTAVLPLGSETPLEIDVRLIVATNKDLEERVKQELFREDLFYRIHVIPVELPP